MTTTTDRALVSADPVLTGRVLDSVAGAPSPRTREILRGVVTHLHALASELALTEPEWAGAVDFVTRVGQTCNERRQETILLSDVLGLSMLVVGINHPSTERATASTVFGPFFTEGSPAFANGDDISGGAPGSPCYYSGRVTSSAGAPVPGAHIEVWHADEAGNYDVQYDGLDHPQGRGHLRADEQGRYWFWSVLPEPYPIPDDGPVGQLLAAAGRGPMRPAHVHFMISAPGFRTLTTHVFRAGDPHLGSDAVFGERDSLVRAFVPREPGRAPDGRDCGPYHEATYDFRLDEQEDVPSPR